MQNSNNEKEMNRYAMQSNDKSRRKREQEHPKWKRKRSKVWENMSCSSGSHSVTNIIRRLQIGVQSQCKSINDLGYIFCEHIVYLSIPFPCTAHTIAHYIDIQKKGTPVFSFFFAVIWMRNESASKWGSDDFCVHTIWWVWILEAKHMGWHIEWSIWGMADIYIVQ